jgi:hypothetical protein
VFRPFSPRAIESAIKTQASAFAVCRISCRRLGLGPGDDVTHRVPFIYLDRSVSSSAPGAVYGSYPRGEAVFIIVVCRKMPLLGTEVGCRRREATSKTT